MKQRRMRTGWKYLIGLTLLPWLLAGCQPIQPSIADANERTASVIPDVSVEVQADDILIPADFPGGIVAVTVKNSSTQDLDISFVRLHEGITAEAVYGLSDVGSMENLLPLSQMTSFMASFNPLRAGESERVIMDFRTGDFLIDATDHVEGEPVPNTPRFHGTFSTDKLVGTSEPKSDVTAILHDFSITIPDEIEAGSKLWEFDNQGEQWHMVFFAKLAPNATIADALAALQEEGEPSGPPPFEIVENGGVAPISQGERMWLEFSLEPGTYIVACPLPDFAAMLAGEAPMSHIHHGMFRTLTVTAK